MKQDKTAEIEQGERIAEYADRLWGWDTPAGRLRAERRAELLVREGRIEKGTDLLELGCGTGVFSLMLAETGANITAVDISSDLLEKAKQKSSFGNIRFELADAEDLPFDKDSFDVIAGCTVLHHLELEPVLRQIKRVLRPNGKIVFAEPNMLNPQLLIQKNIPFIKRLMGDTPTETAFFKWVLHKQLKKYGFCDISVVPFDFLHPWTPSMAIPMVKRLGFWLESLPLMKEIAGSQLISATLKQPEA